MDKRFFLALLLTALVVAITPILFPGAPRRPAVRGARVDSTAGAAAMDTTRAAAVAAPVAAPARDAGAPSSVAQASDSLARPVAADTATVVTTKSTYRFSSVGAAPVSVTMHDYHALTRTGKKENLVELVKPRESLLRYRLVTGGDTLALDRTAFTLTRSGTGAGESLRYETAISASRVGITYTFAPDSYVVRVRGEVQGAGGPAFLLVDLPTGLRSEEADTLDDHQHFAYAFKPKTSNAKSIGFSKLDPGERKLEPGPLNWVVAKSKYFLVGLLTPAGDRPFAELTVTGGPRTSKLATSASATAVETMPDGRFAFEIYAGPQEWERLRALGGDFENANPYGGFLQGVVQPFATIVMRMLLWMRRNLGLSYGWLLVVFGVAVRLIMWPLNQGAMRTSLKMQRIQPMLQATQERYKNDPQKLQTEMMKVYKEHNMSPLSALSGCLPMLLPMPVFFALYFVFQNTIEFRGVPFLWLHDISLKDPYYILPLLMGASAYLLAWIGMRNAPPNPQAKMMSYLFPGMMTFVLLNFASGLNLYYAVQNLAALPQQWLIARERQKAGPAPAPVRTVVREKPIPKRV